MKKQKLAVLNSKIQVCKKCRLAETRKHPIKGEGNTRSRLFLIAQAPGNVEDEKGKMFLGPSGIVLDKLLYQAKISREDLYMTNLIKCHLPKNRKPKKQEIQACHDYLDQEITIIKPDILIPLGHYATRYMLRKYHQRVPSKHDFYKLYGTLLYFQKQKIYPIQHPAAVLHDDSIQLILERNYRKLFVFSQPCKWASLCPMKRYEEKGLIDEKWRSVYCYGDWENCVRYQMEKQHKYHEDWMLPDGTLANHLKKHQ